MGVCQSRNQGSVCCRGYLCGQSWLRYQERCRSYEGKVVVMDGYRAHSVLRTFPRSAFSFIEYANRSMIFSVFDFSLSKFSKLLDGAVVYVSYIDGFPRSPSSSVRAMSMSVPNRTGEHVSLKLILFCLYESEKTLPADPTGFPVPARRPFIHHLTCVRNLKRGFLTHPN